MSITSLDDAAWDSPWRRRRVGEKAALSLGLVLVALCTPSMEHSSLLPGLAGAAVWPGPLLVAVVSVVVILGPARISPRVLSLAMSAPLVFLALGGVSVLVSLGASPSGRVWWTAGPVSIGPASAAQAASLVEHGVGGALAVMVLAMTTPMVDLLTAMRVWRIPDALLEIASLTYRLIFVLLDTVVATSQAQRCRLGDTPAGRFGGWRRRLDNTASLMGSVALRSWNRATRLNEGMVNRGYESALVTLPVARVRSRRFQVVAAFVLVATWLACWALTGRMWR